jgi:hypothetical protein
MADLLEVEANAQLAERYRVEIAPKRERAPQGGWPLGSDPQ